MADTPSYYIYFISSIPMLHFEMKPPFPFEEFILMCKGMIADKDIAIIREAALSFETPDRYSNHTLREYNIFDMKLRNELVRIRAGRRKSDALKYLRHDGYADHRAAFVAMNAYRNPSILNGERMLDQERWRFLDELSFGRYFDIDALIIYALKLLILEKWERINTADGAALAEKAVQKV